MQDLFNRGTAQLVPHQNDDDGHRQPGYVFVAAVAEGVFLIRLAAAEFEADQCQHGGTGVGKIVEGVCHNADGAADHTGKVLARKQAYVQENAHHAAQGAVGGAQLGRGEILSPDEDPLQYRDHTVASFFWFILSV